MHTFTGVLMYIVIHVIEYRLNNAKQIYRYTVYL